LLDARVDLRDGREAKMNMATLQEMNAPPEGAKGDDPGRFREKLIRMFDVKQSSTSDEEVEARLSDLARDFIGAKNASTDIKLEELIAKFAASEIPHEPSDMSRYMAYLADNVVAHSSHTSSPRFIGHMTSALPSFVRGLSALLIAMNQNTVKMETAKACTPFERHTLALMHRLVYNFTEEFYRQHAQQSASTLGVMVSGGTVGNITALWCARNASLGPQSGFAGIEQEGLAAALNHYGYRGAVIIGSSLMHYSMEKAADLLGLGTRGLVKVATDGHNRIDLRELRRTIEECRSRRLHIIALVGIAGTTDTGSIDPLSELARIACEVKTHFHVDAAWGGPMLFSEQHKHLLTGIEQADSVTIDGHKQMYLPQGVGVVVLRNPQLAQAIEKKARYIVRASSIDLGKRALEGSRPANAVFLHAALHLIGRQGYEFLIDEGIRKARLLAELLRARSEFELLAEPQINILNYRYVPRAVRDKVAAGTLTEHDNELINRFNEQLQKAQRRAGRTFVSRTTVETARYGKGCWLVALRVVLANPLTTETDIQEVLADQIEIAAQLERAPVAVAANVERGVADGGH
jgi:glutamate decarboxylase